MTLCNAVRIASLYFHALPQEAAVHSLTFFVELWPKAHSIWAVLCRLLFMFSMIRFEGMCVN